MTQCKSNRHVQFVGGPLKWIYDPYYAQGLYACSVYWCASSSRSGLEKMALSTVTLLSTIYKLITELTGTPRHWINGNSYLWLINDLSTTSAKQTKYSKLRIRIGSNHGLKQCVWCQGGVWKRKRGLEWVPVSSWELPLKKCAGRLICRWPKSPNSLALRD